MLPSRPFPDLRRPGVVVVLTALLAALPSALATFPVVAQSPGPPGAGPGAALAARAGAEETKGARELSIYAAASLRDALNALTPALEKAAGARIVFNFAGSNDLARQILAADNADIFISADEGWMDKIAEEGLVDKESRRSLLSNRLVVVAASDSALTVLSAEDLGRAAIDRIAMADPEAVPAGKYAKAWLTKKGQWNDALRAKILATADVRAALAAVASGNVPVAIVYKTDAAVSSRVRVVYVVPETDAPAISYPIAVMAHCEHAEAARKVAGWLAGPEARIGFEKFGFITKGSAASK